MGEMKVSVEALEKERDFYFNKVRYDNAECADVGRMADEADMWCSQLRDIEIIVGARMEEPDDTTEQEILKRIQEILYQTEVRRISLPLRETYSADSLNVGCVRRRALKCLKKRMVWWMRRRLSESEQNVGYDFAIL
jgi:hypothetical protein